jgi:hypothetical protein
LPQVVHPQRLMPNRPVSPMQRFKLSDDATAVLVAL